LAVLAGIFLVSAVITQFISNTSSALVMMPIGLATASELGVSALPLMMGVAMGASASFLTPFANGVSLCNDDDAEVLLKTIIVVCPEEAIAN